MGEHRIAGVTGVVFGLAAVPVLHFVAVDLESKQPAQAFMTGVGDHWSRISVAGGLGLLLAAVLLVHLVAVRRLAARGSQDGSLLADATTAVAALAAAGVALSSACATLAAYGAHEEYPYEAVRSLGLIAENLVAVLMPAVAGTAILVATMGIRMRVLPRWLGVTAATFAAVLSLLGVLLPGAGLLPGVLWVLVSGAALTLTDRRLSRAAADEHTSPATA